MKRMTRTSLGALMLTVVIPSAALSQNVTELEEINVVAEEADGVVQGYIATNTLSGSKTGDVLPAESAVISSPCSGFGPLLTVGDTPTG